MEQLLIKQLVKVFNKGGGMMMNYEEPLLGEIPTLEELQTTTVKNQSTKAEVK